MVISTEAAKETGKVNVLTDRVLKRKQECNDAPRKILFQRARSLTASWKETEADPNRLRWGKAFARVLEDSPIIIRDSELIVGVETKDIRGAEIVPECNPYDVLEQLASKNARTMSEVMSATIDPDEAGIKEIANYWVGKSVNDIVYKAYETKMGESYKDLIDGRRGKVAVLPDVNGTVYKTQTIYNPRIMKDGLGGLIKKAKAEKQKALQKSEFVPNDYTAIFHKLVILDVMIMTCEALIKYAGKHADLARKMAKTAPGCRKIRPAPSARPCSSTGLSTSAYERKRPIIPALARAGWMIGYILITRRTWKKANSPGRKRRN
jgi:formate C-acetyltransferase